MSVHSLLNADKNKLHSSSHTPTLEPQVLFAPLLRCGSPTSRLLICRHPKHHVVVFFFFFCHRIQAVLNLGPEAESTARPPSEPVDLCVNVLLQILAHNHMLSVCWCGTRSCLRFSGRWQKRGHLLSAAECDLCLENSPDVLYNTAANNHDDDEQGQRVWD